MDGSGGPSKHRETANCAGTARKMHPLHIKRICRVAIGVVGNVRNVSLELTHRIHVAYIPYMDPMGQDKKSIARYRPLFGTLSFSSWDVHESALSRGICLSISWRAGLDDPSISNSSWPAYT